MEFDAKGLKTEGKLATLTEAPATLTDGGSQAFNSMYKAGTEMDPVSLAVALDATAQLPALPDLGSTASPAAPAAASPSAEPAPVAKDAESSDAGLFIALAVAVLVLAAWRCPPGRAQAAYGPGGPGRCLRPGRCPRSGRRLRPGRRSPQGHVHRRSVAGPLLLPFSLRSFRSTQPCRPSDARSPSRPQS